MFKFKSTSEEQTEKFGELLARGLTDASVIALDGDLGAGKTCLARGIARGLGVTSFVSSPTFTIVNEYEGDRELFHFDMYRLASGDELFDIGWEDYLARGAVCAVEWSENVEDAFTGEEIIVRFEKTGPTDRRIIIEGGDGAC
jgi:tRNA threonylcarbamoyladenosine biosynthesis protein TsaE